MIKSAAWPTLSGILLIKVTRVEMLVHTQGIWNPVFHQSPEGLGPIYENRSNQLCRVGMLENRWVHCTLVRNVCSYMAQILLDCSGLLRCKNMQFF